MRKLLSLSIGLSLLLSGVANAQMALSDIEDYDFQESIQFLQNSEILDGYPDGTFKPNNKINRAEFTKVVMNSLYEIPDLDFYRSDCFPDVSAEDWFSPYVCLAQEEGIINGYPDGTFRPSDLINQAEALKIIYEGFYGEVQNVDGEWFQKYLDAAEYDGMLYFESLNNPGGHEVSRGEVSYFLAWLLDEELALTDQIEPKDFFGEDTIYGWDAESADDCRTNEIFVEEDQFCYLASTVEGIDFSMDGVDGSHESYDDGEDALRFEYLIDGDLISLSRDLSEGSENIKNLEEHNIIWERFVELIPTEDRSKFTEYRVYNNPDSTTLAYVVETDSDLDSWILAVNLNDVFENGEFKYEGELEHTLIHEFAHVLTLSDEQLDGDISFEECFPNYFPGEGCSKQESFINQFVKNFWTSEMLDIVAEEETGESIYLQNPNLFVSDYAATNPGEDIAETFTTFVLKPEPTCQPKATISEQKVCMFYEYPSLKELRLEIRENL